MNSPTAAPTRGSTDPHIALSHESLCATSDPSGTTPKLAIEIRLTLGGRPSPNADNPLDITIEAYGPRPDGDYRAGYYTRDKWTRVGDGLTKEMIGSKLGAIHFVREMLNAVRVMGARVTKFKWNEVNVDYLSGIA